MNQAVPDQTSLGVLGTGLTRRLEGGFGPVTNAGRDRFTPDNDQRAWSSQQLAKALIALNIAQIGHPDLETAHEALTDCFDAEPHTVRAIAHQPQEFLRQLPALLRLASDSQPTGKDTRPDDAPLWRLFAATTDQLWDYLQADSPKSKAHRHLAPLAARTRFLALSEPFRHPDHPVWEGDHRGSGELSRVFGHESWVELVRRARQAREVWRIQLNGHQSVPLLDHAAPLAVEDEVQALAFASRFSGNPLILDAPRPPKPRNRRANQVETGASSPGSGNASAEQVIDPPGSVPPADRAVLEEALEHHLLPRFATGRTWAAVLGWGCDRRPWAQIILFGVVAVSVMAALAATGFALFTEGWGYLPALALAGASYVLIGMGTLIFGRLWAMPLMLRLPAAAAVGMIVLIALHPDWWTNIQPGWSLTGLLALLTGASFGYLLIEARNHNSGQVSGTTNKRFRVLARIGGRALSVTATGAVHAFLVALLGMAVIAPAFSEEGDQLQAVWNLPGPGADTPAHPDAPQPQPSEPHPGSEGGERTPGEPWAILAAATAWCLAAGVFSQILWDDQPITAPLAHRRWRTER